MTVPPRSRLNVFFLTMAVTYAPYLLLFLSRDAQDNAKTIFAIWAIFPGLTLTAFMQQMGFLEKFRGIGATIVMTAVWGAASFFCAWRFRPRLCIPLAAILLGSLGMVFMMLQFLRA